VIYTISNNPNQLVVEGFADLYSVAGLMSAHIAWPPGKMNAPVYIHMGNGAEEILKDGFLTTFLKSSVIKSFGVMLDADTKPRSRYTSIFSHASPYFPAMPAQLPNDGLVVENLTEKKRFGVWIMPDNVSEGCLETFLRHLVPNTLEPAWQHATTSVAEAKRIGCGCHDHHIPKANLYTWLAWQNPPGQSPGESLTKKILDPHSANASTFVSWFRKLYVL
jgi:hypothetical protein